MTTLMHTTYPRTLDTLAEGDLPFAQQGFTIEAWSFDDPASRRAAEARMAERGIQARLRSAYKPLLHFFLEELDQTDHTTTDIEVCYPVIAQAPSNRFLLETYPLAALFPDIRFTFAEGRRDVCVYDVILKNSAGLITTIQVFAPNRMHLDSIQETHLSPTGWLRVRDAAGRTVQDERLATDFEVLFADILRVITDHPWGANEPFFEELNIGVSLPGKDIPLGYGEEIISLHEALHEDLYFSVLEIFQRRSGRPLGDRGLQPGQIVPEVRHGSGGAEVTIELRPLSREELSGEKQELERAESPLPRAQIATELGQIEGTAFFASSRAGRSIEARYHPGSDHPVMISGGQHANETSGIVGALRAAKILAHREGAHFTVSPLENPDGYALHQRLIRDNPRHMHHAARYTALGDDLGHRSNNLFEREIRHRALELSRAQLHINLHGYPSHEWTRPLSGYVPRGFAMWTLPKGFFLIINHHRAWADAALALITRTAEKLREVAGLQEFTRRQMDLYRIQAGSTGFQIIEGFPCIITENDGQEVPLALMTEYPDETCHGNPFIAGHEAQTATVLAAYEAYQQIRNSTQELRSTLIAP